MTSLRPSNAERVPYEEALTQALADGRLDGDLFEQRMGAVAAATTHDDLAAVVVDVPFTPSAPPPVPRDRGRGRRAVLGLLGLGAIGGASWGLTRIWQVPAAAPPGPAATARSGPPVSPGAVATTLVTVPMWTAEMFPVVADHLLSIAVDDVQSLYAYGEFVVVQGTGPDGPVDVRYRVDETPHVAAAEHTVSPSFATDRLRDLDAADLLRRSGEVITLGDQPTIRIDRPPDWVVEVRGTAESVWWDLSGTTRRAPN
ncbi:DUF1707 SHOCT-like domain-containing protein [Propionibacteriaceae bacterium Y2011]